MLDSKLSDCLRAQFLILKRLGFDVSLSRSADRYVGALCARYVYGTFVILYRITINRRKKMLNLYLVDDTSTYRQDIDYLLGVTDEGLLKFGGNKLYFDDFTKNFTWLSKRLLELGVCGGAK